MEIKLDGRAALITGGSKGLGLAMATRFAASGADVAILARDQKALDEAQAVASKGARGRVVAISCDVSKAEPIAKGFQAVIDAFGKVDILVNNAGSSQNFPLMEVTDELFQSDLDLKVFAALRLSRLAWPKMKERRWGRIINVLNIGAKAPKAASMPTSVSRAAGMAITKAMAGEGAPHNVLVNALLVGKIVSDQWIRRHQRKNDGTPLESYLAAQGKDLPMGRMGEAEEFANIACFLASDAAGYISGTAINVDGNLSPVV